MLMGPQKEFARLSDFERLVGWDCMTYVWSFLDFDCGSCFLYWGGGLELGGLWINRHWQGIVFWFISQLRATSITSKKTIPVFFLTRIQPLD